MYLLLFLLSCAVALGERTYAHVSVQRLDGTPVFSVRVDSKPISMSSVDLQVNGAHGWYEAKTLNTTGWAELKVVIEEDSPVPQHEKAYAAGYLEGYLTWLQIYQMAININGGQVPYSSELHKFITENNAYVHAQVEKNPNDPLWAQTGLLYNQFDGLYAGYVAAASKEDPRKVLPKDVIYAVNIMGDLDDLCPAFGCKKVLTTCSSSTECDMVNKKFSRTKEFQKHQNIRYPVPRKGDGHCSILIKPIGDINAPTDVVFGHTTWSSFGSMGPRIMKLYDFPYFLVSNTHARVPGRKIAFSSYPGTLYSNDDWYNIDSALTVSETTIANNNATLYKSLTPSCILIWARTMAANRLAYTGKAWTAMIARENSGTYNNAWHIIDWKTWHPNSPLPRSDFLWQVELMPTYAFPLDLSETLRTRGYWASYNRIYNRFLYDITMQPELLEKYGDHFSWAKTSRAQIFEREHHTVVDLESFRKLMRYNKFQTDPMGTQGCKDNARSASNAISERGDLSSPVDCINDVARQDEAGTDLKFTSRVTLDNSKVKESFLRFYAVAGPTNDDQPTFIWSKSPFANLAHLGQADEWNFPLVDFDSQWV